MILVGSQRGGARDLAQHLMKAENEHVEVFEVRGFASETLNGAFNEAYALSRAGQCRKFLFSLSVNPPTGAVVTTNAFVKAIDRAEEALGLVGQPRAIVFHEKKGRRHAHAVWSRISPETLKAVHLPFTKRKLVGLTRDLFVEHGWRMPDGLIDPAKRDPRNFTLAEWQQAQRQGKDPRTRKKAIQDAWSIARCREEFESELNQRGYWLARGDRRGFVVMDHKLEPYSLPRSIGIKTGEVRARLGEPSGLPSVDEARRTISNEMGRLLDRLQTDLEASIERRSQAFERRRSALVSRQRRQREALVSKQLRRQCAEFQARQARFRRGLGGIWDRLRGEHGRIRQQNERETVECLARDRKERDDLVVQHLGERDRIRILRYKMISRSSDRKAELQADRQRYSELRRRENRNAMSLPER